MILLCGIPSEPPIAAVIDRLDSLGVQYSMFNQRDVSQMHLQWTLVAGRIQGKLTLADGAISLDSIRGVYLRIMDDQALPEIEDAPADLPLAYHSKQLHQSLINWADIAPIRIVSRYRNMGSNGSKPYQAQMILRTGFSTPETLITNNPIHVREFVAQQKRVIYKSISGVRSIVAEMGAEEWERLDAIRSCPVQFQAYVEGLDIRVHTVGSQIFATRVESTVTDYRYAGHGEGSVTLTPYDLPSAIGDRCLKLADTLQLPFAGIDLRITPSGDVVCFEVNPSPAYSYYEAHTGQPISKALAEYLAGISA